MTDYEWKAEQYDAGFPRLKEQIDTLSDRISALEAENAALKAERDEANARAEQLTGNLDSCYAILGDGYDDTLEVRIQKIIDERNNYRHSWFAVSDALGTAYKSVVKLEAERDAARAWAAAWKRAAKYERGYPASISYDAGQDNDQTVARWLQPMKRNSSADAADARREEHRRMYGEE